MLATGRSATGPKALPIGGGEEDDRTMSEGPHTCPYCELRFEYHDEIRDHISHDHPDHPDVVAGVEIHEMPHP